MATEKQALANRLNAQRSTGPKTLEGKEIAAQNSTKHGVLARKNVICSEIQADFDIHQDQMLAQLKPVGPMESMLAMRVISLSWRLKRAEDFQTQTFNALNTKKTLTPLQRMAQSMINKYTDQPPLDPTQTIGQTVISDFSKANVLDRLLRYERRIEASLYKTLNEIQRLKLIRKIENE
ncbi:MAG: hypothetical protein FVQ79_10115 [Planctomycetes bacterium]|nr:hypothetical protein [Planctomycetota bacterium]